MRVTRQERRQEGLSLLAEIGTAARQFWTALLLVVLLVIVATFYYYEIESARTGGSWTLIDAFYMAVIVVTTLGTMALARGMASWFSLELQIRKEGRVYDKAFLNIARYYFTPEHQYIPITFVYVVVLYILISLVLRYTKYGRNVYAVGSNEYASRLAGVNTTRIKFLSYVISGVTASLAGVVLVAQLSLGRDDAGLGSELEVITAVVLGGVSLSGGKGNLLGVIVAVLIIGVIRNGMVHLEQVIGLSYYWREVVKGVILIIAISIDSARLMAIKRRQVVRQ